MQSWDRKNVYEQLEYGIVEAEGYFEDKFDPFYKL